MREALRNEIAKLTGIAALGLWASGRPQTAMKLGAFALGLRLYPMPRYSFAGRSVVITGGSRGLGLALAEELISQGAVVTLLAREEGELEKAKQLLLKQTSRPVLTVACDITQSDQVGRAVTKVVETIGRVDVLINNAGAITVGPFESMTEDDFKEQFNIHCAAVVKTTTAVLPFFKEQGEGRVINISSIGGKFGIPHMAPYCASKFALAGLSMSLDMEMRKYGVTTTTIYPGLMRTGSPVHAQFKGDHEKEFAWFAASDSLPGGSISAASAAKQILRASAQGRTEAVISATAKFGTLMKGHFPEIFMSLLSWVERLMPQKQSLEVKTGEQSRGWLESKIWSGPLVKTMNEASERYNENEQKLMKAKPGTQLH